MFTIGIFTTHIPYIAFVAFYAFFVLFGVGKASSGDFTSGENQILKVYHTQTFTADHHGVHDSASGEISASAVYSPGSNETPLPHTKYLHKDFLTGNFKQLLTYTSLFCRPPPSLI
jgi:hypothetical protein